MEPPRQVRDIGRAHRPIWSRRRSRSCDPKRPRRSFPATAPRPPPLIRSSAGSTSSAPSTVRSSRSTSSSVVKAMPHCSAWARVASDVGTPITFRPARTFSPKRSTKCRAVEPVPRPSFMPSLTCSSARAAACRFSASMSTCAMLPACLRGISSVVFAGNSAESGLSGAKRQGFTAISAASHLRWRVRADSDFAHDLPPHCRIRSRRHAGRHRAGPDQRPQFRARPRRPAAGPARLRAQHDRRRRAQADRARARGRRPHRQRSRNSIA